MAWVFKMSETLKKQAPWKSWKLLLPVFIGPSTLCGTFKFLWETRVRFQLSLAVPTQEHGPNSPYSFISLLHRALWWRQLPFRFSLQVFSKDSSCYQLCAVALQTYSAMLPSTYSLLQLQCKFSSVNQNVRGLGSRSSSYVILTKSYHFPAPWCLPPFNEGHCEVLGFSTILKHKSKMATLRSSSPVSMNPKHPAVCRTLTLSCITE